MSFPPNQNPTMAQLTGEAKLAEVTRLLAKLETDLIKICMLPHQRDAALEELKIYGRNPENSDPIFTRQGIEVLTKHAFNSPSYTTSRNALRCLANAMLLRATTRQIYVDLGFESKACARLKNDSRDDEFLVSRILFLTTYDTNINIESLIDQHHLAEMINQNLHRHAKALDKKKLKSDPMEEMALTETLKLLFNLTHFCPQRNSAFIPSIPSIVQMTCKRQLIPQTPMAASMGPLINSLINLDVDKSDDAQHALFPKSDHQLFSSKLVELLDLCTKSYSQNEIEQQASPLLTLMRKVYEVAPKEVKASMEKKILPSDEDRKQVLGQTSSLPSRLLKLSTSPLAPQVREGLSNLLFEMSDKDAKAFVQNVGYGFASGFLFQHNVPIPENALDAWSTSSTGDGPSSSSSARGTGSGFGSSMGPGLVNPVTGQRLADEVKDEGPEMTMEEKEREAEKLMVLFERLKANGIIDVENPVHKAAAEGRFVELDSDEDSE